MAEYARNPDGSLVTILVEVKNIRDWIYLNAAELYQLLDKAARLQATGRGTSKTPAVPVGAEAMARTW